ncbi:RNA polymerase sigma factor [Flavobacterium sp. RHBU_24]|uniref:RNA polymerase sigma factor n=1 Tax=Flavobacterium sp. RHBU_24 TaxID=3391185 RepID=UPI003984DDA1
MKIIKLHTSDESLIKRILRHDTRAERELYERHAPKMLGVCRLYIKDLHYAEDVMIQAFTRAFDNLGKFRHEGSFEGWLRRIMVREAIDFLRGRTVFRFEEIETAEVPLVETDDNHLDADLLQLLIDQLPDGYRTVMVMHAIEGYSHKEIAETLGITESTSKSQLFKARRQLQEQLQHVKRLQK